MVQEHKWSLSDIENLIPFERDLYIEMLAEHVKKQNQPELEHGF